MFPASYFPRCFRVLEPKPNREVAFTRAYFPEMLIPFRRQNFPPAWRGFRPVPVRIVILAVLVILDAAAGRLALPEPAGRLTLAEPAGRLRYKLMALQRE